MLTNKGKYGLKAMVHLAGLPPAEVAQVGEIAEANDIPKKFLDQIFSELRKAGLVHSKKGKAGGYALAKSAESISVGQIVRVLDGPLAPIQCSSVTAYRPCGDCGDENIAPCGSSCWRRATRLRRCSIPARWQRCVPCPGPRSE